MKPRLLIDNKRPIALPKPVLDPFRKSEIDKVITMYKKFPLNKISIPNIKPNLSIYKK